jgi:hypothetical protein
MEAFHRTAATSPSRLSGLYTRHKAARPPTSAEDAPEILSLHRKYRIQRDRLIAWGLEWNDGENQQVNIDDSVERAGLTEIVLSVMENIKVMLDEVENIRLEPVTGPFPIEKAPKRQKIEPWTRKEREQYEDLIRDFTSAIDLLCDMKTRQPPKSPASGVNEKGKLYIDRKSVAFATPAPATVRPLSPVNTRPTLEPQELVWIDHSLLIMPVDGPPPYDDSGVPRPTRIFADLNQTKQDNSSSTIPVIIEYAHFDRTYKEDNIPLSLVRLQRLNNLLRSPDTKSESVLPRLLGCFEDPQQPRYGLVFELPRKTRKTVPEARRLYKTSNPTTLLDILQDASRKQANPTSGVGLWVPSLDDRFTIAHKLVSGICALSSQSYSHGEINSHAVALLPRVPRPSSSTSFEFRDAFLGGFDLFTESTFDPAYRDGNQNIYRHPADPKVTGTDNIHLHESVYDLYSLGLVLLEIGLWMPLSDIFKEKYSLEDFRLRINRIWARRLASKCGSAYMRAVQKCLGADGMSDQSPEAMYGLYLEVKALIARCCFISEPEVEEDDDVASDEEGVKTLTGRPPLLETTTSQLAVEEAVQSPIANIADNPRPQVDVTRTTEVKVPAPASTTEPLPFAATLQDVCPAAYWDMKIPASLHARWNTDLEHGICSTVTKILNKHFNKKTSCMISLEMCGPTRETARPTITVMASRETDKIEKRLRRKYKEALETFDLVVYGGSIRRSADTRKHEPRNAFHQDHPVCGASIGAYTNEEHSPPATFGGVIMVDDEPYGMSVHHMLEAPESDTEEEDLSTVARSAEDRRTSSSSSEHLASSETSYHDSDSDASDESEEEREESDSAGDTPGHSVQEVEDIVITQPALDDVPPDFFPVEEDKDEDHLDSHTLGSLHASSGLRRIDHILHAISAKVEIDWALIKLNPPRMQRVNVIAGSKPLCPNHTDTEYRPTLCQPVFRDKHKPSEDLYPRFVAPSTELAGLAVHSVGRTTGLTSGIIRSTPLVCFPGRRSVSRVWAIGGGMGIPGDSGAWVIDDTGRVCGHILAWTSAGRAAFMAPMDVTLDDMKRSLGAQVVKLPGALSWEGVTKSPRPDTEAVRTLRLATIINGVDIERERSRQSAGHQLSEKRSWSPLEKSLESVAVAGGNE